MNSGSGTPASVRPPSSLGSQHLRSRSGPHITNSARPHVRYAPPASSFQPTKSFRQRLRVQQFQRRWEHIKEDLPPQLTRKHIDMISVGGVIGTGLFLGSGDALKNGGPVGAFLGYAVIGSVVFCLCVSIGEMIAFLPNVGGVVGLADLYVDKAMGFSLGWAAWYNWAVTLPAEITAAAILTKFWNQDAPVAAISGGFLLSATFVNCFPSRVYGELEFYLSTFKVLTIVVITIISLLIDFGISQQGPIGLERWLHPAFGDNFLGVDGPLGGFLGFWAVLMQASFSFFGSEVPGIAAGEVIDATRVRQTLQTIDTYIIVYNLDHILPQNVPRALQRVWIRITLFYVGSVFCAGLIIDWKKVTNYEDVDSNSVNSSPFVIAFKQAGIPWLAHGINAAVLVSAWSAAASDIYVGSRFLFFLARCNHAPKLFASLIRYPKNTVRSHWHATGSDEEEGQEEDALSQDEEDLPPRLDTPTDEHAVSHAFVRECCELSEYRRKGYSGEDDEIQIEVCAATPTTVASRNGSLRVPQRVSGAHMPSQRDLLYNGQTDVEAGVAAHDPLPKLSNNPFFVLPLWAVFGTAAVGLLCFLDSARGGAPEEAFVWLVAVASVASLQSWAGMLYTYIRWHKGTIYAEQENMARLRLDEDDEDAKKVIRDIELIKTNRYWGQPYIAYYAFISCMVILLTNGWSVFLHSGWSIAIIPGQLMKNYPNNQRPTGPVSQFLSSYVPLPFFIFLTFGYKLIHKTDMVRVENMTFSREKAPRPVEETSSDTSGLIDKILEILLVI